MHRLGRGWHPPDHDGGDSADDKASDDATDPGYEVGVALPQVEGVVIVGGVPSVPVMSKRSWLDGYEQQPIQDHDIP